MLKLLRFFASRLVNQEPLDERTENAAQGPVRRMMQCDLSNLDRLTKALGEHRT